MSRTLAKRASGGAWMVDDGNYRNFFLITAIGGCPDVEEEDETKRFNLIRRSRRSIPIRPNNLVVTGSKDKEPDR